MEWVITLLVVVAIWWAIRKFAAPSDYTDEQGRIRCGRCKKIVYDDGEVAHSAAESAVNRGTYLRAYYEGRCGKWHLTSQEPRC